MRPDVDLAANGEASPKQRKLDPNPEPVPLDATPPQGAFPPAREAKSAPPALQLRASPAPKADTPRGDSAKKRKREDPEVGVEPEVVELSD